MVTASGAFAPSTVISAIRALSAPVRFATGRPPRATRYRLAPVPAPSVPIANEPSAPVRVCASWAGAPSLAAHNVTVESTIGAPAPRTWPRSGFDTVVAASAIGGSFHHAATIVAAPKSANSNRRRDLRARMPFMLPSDREPKPTLIVAALVAPGGRFDNYLLV